MRYGIALGSNLGDRLEHLRFAVQAILQRIPNARLTAAAPVYETAPVDCPEDSPSFFNTVIELETNTTPLEVLHELRAIELDMGRPNVHGHHAPRTVDLDILYADDVVMRHPDLVLPHPRMMQRRFVMQPLADIRPELVPPGQTETVLTLLAKISSHEPAPFLAAKDWS
jgi:2-amino-4-hydroxy-6-hydroxymethyldihydropteridine diphosphokinase